MLYKERFNDIKDYIRCNIKHILDSYEKDGYKYYAERYYKHIDLLSYPEIYMTDKELDEKRKVLKRIEELEYKLENDFVPTSLDLVTWDFLQDKEIPTWREYLYK